MLPAVLLGVPVVVGWMSQLPTSEVLMEVEEEWPQPLGMVWMVAWAFPISCLMGQMSQHPWAVVMEWRHPLGAVVMALLHAWAEMMGRMNQHPWAVMMGRTNQHPWAVMMGRMTQHP